MLSHIKHDCVSPPKKWCLCFCAQGSKDSKSSEKREGLVVIMRWRALKKHTCEGNIIYGNYIGFNQRWYLGTFWNYQIDRNSASLARCFCLTRISAEDCRRRTFISIKRRKWEEKGAWKQTTHHKISSGNSLNRYLFSAPLNRVMSVTFPCSALTIRTNSLDIKHNNLSKIKQLKGNQQTILIKFPLKYKTINDQNVKWPQWPSNEPQISLMLYGLRWWIFLRGMINYEYALKIGSGDSFLHLWLHFTGERSRFWCSLQSFYMTEQIIHSV